jgi:hypothetical protein
VTFLLKDQMTNELVTAVPPEKVHPELEVQVFRLQTFARSARMTNFAHLHTDSKITRVVAFLAGHYRATQEPSPTFEWFTPPN